MRQVGNCSFTLNLTDSMVCRPQVYQIGQARGQWRNGQLLNGPVASAPGENLNTVAAHVRDELGLARFEIGMTRHDPVAVERKRPDSRRSARATWGRRTRRMVLRPGAKGDGWWYGWLEPCDSRGGMGGKVAAEADGATASLNRSGFSGAIPAPSRYDRWSHCFGQCFGGSRYVGWNRAPGRAVAWLSRCGRTGRTPETRELMVAGTSFHVVYLLSDDIELIRVLRGAQQWPPENEETRTSPTVRPVMGRSWLRGMSLLFCRLTASCRMPVR